MLDLSGGLSLRVSDDGGPSLGLLLLSLLLLSFVILIFILLGLVLLVDKLIHLVLIITVATLEVVRKDAIFDLRVLAGLELLIVGVGVPLVLEIVGVLGGAERCGHFCGKLQRAIVLHQPLLLLVKDDEEDALVAKFGELDGLLDKASLPFAVGNVPLVFVGE